MVAAEIQQQIETNTPGMEVVRLEVDDGETYSIQKISGIEAATVHTNRNGGAGDGAFVTFTAGGSEATIELVGTTSDVRCTLILWGR